MSIPLLYIAGAGRSGSTVLSILLDQHPQVVSRGELCQLTLSGWAEREYCACGRLGTECPFWQAVRRRWAGADGERRLAEYVALQRRFEGRRHWPWRFADLDWGSPEFQRYRRGTEELLAAVLAEGGGSLLVDASKDPARAYALAHMAGIDLHLLHLVRDARGVAWSLRRSFARDDRAGVQRDLPARPLWRSTAFWLVTNLLAGWVARRLPAGRALLLRYEDFVADPGAALQRIGELVGLELAPLGALAAAGGELAPGHTVAGNRLRMGGTVRLTADHSWQQGLTAAERRQVWRWSGWLMGGYGYAPGPAAGS